MLTTVQIAKQQQWVYVLYILIMHLLVVRMPTQQGQATCIGNMGIHVLVFMGVCPFNHLLCIGISFVCLSLIHLLVSKLDNSQHFFTWAGLTIPNLTLYCHLVYVYVCSGCACYAQNKTNTQQIVKISHSWDINWTGLKRGNVVKEFSESHPCRLLCLNPFTSTELYTIHTHDIFVLIT